MEPFSLEELFLAAEDQATPGAHLYLYRLLAMLAAERNTTGNPAMATYPGAKRLAIRLGLGSSEKLAGLFRDLGLGELTLDINPDAIMVTLNHDHAPQGASTVPGPACELERGLIDGSLEMITGLPVKTRETSCWTQGSQTCTFEACMDRTTDQPRYISDSIAAHATGKAIGDGMTSRRLRSWYLDLAARELARSRRHGRPLSVLYLDLDDLGQVNEEHGRHAGDQVINAVSAALSRSCRTEDFLWHNGEDEFALLLTETGTEAADIVAKRLSTAIYATAENIDFAARISASIGYSTFPVHADDLASLLETARSAQYLAKARGKGRTQVARSELHGTEVKEEAGPAGRRKQDEATSTEGEAFDPRRSLTTPDDGTPPTRDSKNEPVTLVVAMSGPLLMAGMKQIFSGNKAIEIMEEVADPLGLPETVEDMRPDIILTDVAMALAEDYATLRLIEEDNLPIKFIIIADVIDQEVIQIASDYAIDGIILQSTSPKEIIKAIHTAYQGQPVMPDEVKSAIKELESKRKLLNELSERELEVLKLIAEGKSNSQISEDLYITVNTVRFHLANIYQKLGVSNRTEAANCYLRQDIDPDSQPRLL